MKNKTRKIATLLGIKEGVVAKALDVNDGSRIKPNTLKKLWETYTAAQPGSKDEEVALEDWRMLALAKAQTIKTINQARALYQLIPRGSESERVTLEKWLGLCTTTTQARAVYNTLSFEDDNEVLVLTKWLELCSTPTQIRTLYHNISNRVDFKNAAIRKLAKLLS